MASFVAALVISYLLGAFPTAIIAGKMLKGIDVREYGSHNAGATNVWRVLGAVPAIVVLLIDACKGAAAVLVVARIGVSAAILDVQTTEVLCGAMAIAGHIWTVFAGFRGGKGVGTAAGVFAALAPWAVLVAFAVFVVVVASTRFISAGSLAAAVALVMGLVIQRVLDPATLSLTVVLIGCCVAALVIVKHRSNIQRLMKGTENRFGKPATAQPKTSERGSA